MRKLLATAVFGAVILTLAGCGGDDESSTTKWADGVCSAMTTWKQAVTDAGTSLTSGLSTSGLQSAAESVETATETLVDDLKGLGRPETEAGEQAEEIVTGLADGLSGEVETIRTTVEGASGVSGTVQAVSSVAGILRTMGTQIGTAVTALSQLDGAQEIEDAFDEADSCQELRSS